MTDDEATCATCGSTPEDRKRSNPELSTTLDKCPHCGADKCCICDMGDDVACMACEGNDD